MTDIDPKDYALEQLPGWIVDYIWIEGPTVEHNGRVLAQTHRGAVVHRETETVPALSKRQAKRYIQRKNLPNLVINSVKLAEALAIVTEMLDEPWHPGWQPQPHMLMWFRQFLSMQREGSMWGSSHGHVYKISPANKTLTLVAGNPNDPVSWHKKNIITLGKLGWKVLPDVLNQDGQASFAESEEDDLKDEIGRLTTPVPDARGVVTFRHRGSTINVECSHTGYFLPVIQPVHYGSDEEANDDTGRILYTDALLSLRHKGHTTVKAVLDAYIQWGTASAYQREEDIDGHPRHVLANLDIVRDWPSTSGKVATLRL